MNRFNHRIVRDLAWVIASPPLVSTKVPTKELSENFNNTHWWNYSNCLDEFNDCLPALIALDKNPAPLEKHLAQLNSKRLGLHFESFIAFWLNISPNYKLLTQNLQLMEPMKKGSHTLGEIDFILRNMQTDEIIHLEVAVKFYLGSAPYENPMRWFGTNTKDQLGKKVDHLINHQTQLSIKFPQHLNNHGYSIDKKECFLKGRLFYPLDSDVSPQGISDNHLRGRWTQSAELFSNKRLCSIEKLDWLSTLSKDDLKNQKIGEGFTNEERAKCYVSVSDDNNEIERVFKLPEDFIFPE